MVYKRATASARGAEETVAALPAARQAQPAAREQLSTTGRESLPAQRAAKAGKSAHEEKRRQPNSADHALGARESAVLDFEKRRWKHAGAKEQAIRDTFDLPATRYYQILNALLDDPAALAYSPALVGRLRRVREARQQARH